MKPLLCVDGRMLFSSGIGTYLQTLLSGLTEVFSTTILVLSRQKERSESMFSCKSISIDAEIYTLQEQRSFFRNIPSCDLFFSPHYNVPLFSVPARKRIVTIHDLCPLVRKGDFPLHKRIGASVLLRRAVSLSDRILTVSEFSKQEIMARLHPDPRSIRVIPNGIIAYEEDSSNLRFDPEKTGPFILYVGNAKPHKNLGRLFRALRRFSSPPPLVWVNGSGDDFPSGNYPVHRLRSVTNGELAYLYRRARLLVHPSLYEGFGLPPVEAFRYGCPVVVSRVASLPEVCGNAAYYVDPYDEESIYKGLAEVFSNEDLRSDLITRGNERARIFASENMIRDHIAVFQETALS